MPDVDLMGRNDAVAPKIPAGQVGILSHISNLVQTGQLKDLDGRFGRRRRGGT